MSIAEELYPLVKDEWEGCQLSEDGKQIFHEDIESYQLLFDEAQEWAGFINWALDELAKMGYGPVMTFNGNEWEVEVALIPNTFRSERCSEGEYPTKTLALAHALLEVNRG